MKAALELLLRVRQNGVNGRAIPPDDSRALAACVDQFAKGKSVADAFGVGQGDRQALASRIGRHHVGDLAPHKSQSFSQRAMVLHAELERYHRVAFARDLRLGQRPSGEDGLRYDYLIFKGGELPSKRTLRRELANDPPPGGQLSSAPQTPKPVSKKGRTSVRCNSNGAD